MMRVLPFTVETAFPESAYESGSGVTLVADLTWRPPAARKSRPIFSGVTLPPKIFCVPKKKRKKVGYLFLAPPYSFFAPLEQKKCPKIFFHTD